MISSQRKQVPSSWTPENIIQFASAWNTRRVCNWYFLLNYKGVFKIFLCISSHFTLYFSYVRKGCFVTAKASGAVLIICTRLHSTRKGSHTMIRSHAKCKKCIAPVVPAYSNVLCSDPSIIQYVESYCYYRMSYATKVSLA